ncbi:MAG: carbohydrate ABC transporter permease [Clostridia bacterium]|nr:carbohydrate ABC transporter permease [Clostridia bacterium]
MKNMAIRALLALLSIIVILPLAMTVIYSFCQPGEIKAFLDTRGSFAEGAWMEIKLAPKLFSLRQYYDVLISDGAMLRLYANSAMYTAMIIAGQALVIPMMAYALSRFRFFGRDAIFFVVIMLMLLPFQVTMVPNVLTLRALNLMNTIWAVVLPSIFAPFYIFLLRQYMISIPDEIFEAARIDGSGSWRLLIHVLLPVSKPIIGCAVALSFAEGWNLVEQPLAYLTDNAALMPLSVMFNQLSDAANGVKFAGSALYILPALFVYMYFRDDILDGIQLTEMK